MPYPNPSSITVAIVGGDPTVGHALELMLLSAGYGARFLGGSSSIEVGANPINAAHLVLIAPRSSDADRKALLNHLHSGSADAKPPKARLPVLELVAAQNEARIEEAGLVTRRILWPCRLPDLQREIEAALLRESS